MTRRPCVDVRALLGGYVRDDIVPLERGFVEAHLAHCAACTAVKRALDDGLRDARAEIAVDEDHLVALMASAPSFLPSPSPSPSYPSYPVPSYPVASSPHPRRMQRAVAAVAFASAAAAFAVVAVPSLSPSSPRVAAVAPVVTPVAPPTVVASRELVLETAAPVVVVDNVARIERAPRKRSAQPRVAQVSPPVVSDLASVVAAHNAAIGAASTPANPLAELIPLLDEAARLGRSGDAEEALARYHALEREPRFVAHVDLIAYERARLQGLILGDVDTSLRELRRLAESAGGHVAQEAAVTRCEVERTRDPCAALACLDVVAQSSDGNAADAKRLRDRWSPQCH